MTPPSCVIAIPVHNEADYITACLRAIDGQEGARATRVVLLLNNCTDETATIVRSLAPGLRVPVDIVEITLDARRANAGFARALAVRYAADRLADDDVLMTTDADSEVAPDWISRNLAALQAGADAVCGRAVLNPADAAAIPAQLHQDDARECRYAALLDEIAEAIDPDPHDPLPRHGEHSGASIAVRVGAWRRAGGFPAIASGEDRAFIGRLRRIDARIRHTPDVTVTVSGRLQGRAAGGMAETMRRRIVCQDEYTDASLEPARDRHRRLCLRAAVRAAWAADETVDFDNLAADLSLPAHMVRATLEAVFFGQAWADLEQASPVLWPRRVRFADLKVEIEVATALLAHAARDASSTPPPRWFSEARAA